MNCKIILFIFLISCFTQSFAQYQSDDNWRGKNINVVISKLGDPDEIIHNHDGTTSYTYFKKHDSPMYAPQPTQAIIVGKQAIGIPTPPQQVGATTLILCATTYEVNSQGIIVTVRKQGNGC